MQENNAESLDFYATGIYLLGRTWVIGLGESDSESFSIDSRSFNAGSLLWWPTGNFACGFFFWRWRENKTLLELGSVGCGWQLTFWVRENGGGINKQGSLVFTFFREERTEGETTKVVGSSPFPNGGGAGSLPPDHADLWFLSTLFRCVSSRSPTKPTQLHELQSEPQNREAAPRPSSPSENFCSKL